MNDYDMNMEANTSFALVEHETESNLMRISRFGLWLHVPKFACSKNKKDNMRSELKNKGQEISLVEKSHFQILNNLGDMDDEQDQKDSYF